MTITFSETQKNRLTDLGWKDRLVTEEFETAEQREKAYKKIEKAAIAKNRERLLRLIGETHQPQLCNLEQNLSACLREQGFTQVTTPSIISKVFLERMSLDEAHPLNRQVFWLDQKTCLRPMLAPNLYAVSRQIMNFAQTPLKIFEIGSCFRKESEGKLHLKEFTMLNLVEWGTPMEERLERLKELADIVLRAVPIRDYYLEEEFSQIYGDALDIVSREGIELASTSMGPHPLDSAWKISCSWVGIGFGLERLLVCREEDEGIHRYSKSISFLDGARLNIK
ncbi:MAG: pyrrolysine--tRNA(Pyl) ligase large subunit [Syntrophomonadaceae bacterium]|jgi:phenylalanyl-tRNA synthetase alpha chain|nr:pyrrolysine--tRNA(Pyl) ligase large subunit [Syntrophomonadaceae bacterium]